MSFTFTEKCECAKREVKFRQRVYARMVNVGEMTRENAERQINIMAEIAADYAEMAKKEWFDFGDDHAPRTQRERKHSRTASLRQSPPPAPADSGHSVECSPQVAEEKSAAETPPVGT